LELAPRPSRQALVPETTVSATLSSTTRSIYVYHLPLALPRVGALSETLEIGSDYDYAQIITVAFLLFNRPGKRSLDTLVQSDRKLGPAKLIHAT
jgi:hypothetical protein